MRVLVSGAAGFFGSWLVDAILEQGHEVIGVDNFVGGYRDNVSKHPNYTFVSEDITNFCLSNMVSSWFDRIGDIDVIYHCAALAYEGLSVFSPTLITNNIVTGTIALATYGINHKMKRFVNCSSMARYGNIEAPFRENMHPIPHDPYGMAKLMAEQQLNLLSEIYKFDVIHVAPHNIIGPRQKYDDPYRNVVSIMINLMLQGRQPIIYGDGEQKRCFSFIQDDVKILTKFLNYGLKENCELFNIGPDDKEEFITINHLAKVIAKELNFELKPEYYEERPREVRLAYCSSDKIREVFGYETEYSLLDGIRSIVDYIRKRGTRPFEYHLNVEIQSGTLPRPWKDRLF